MFKTFAFHPADIRNVVLLGSAGAGKTTAADAILHRTGAVTRLGSVDAATSILDHEPEARARHHSTSATVLFATSERREVNLIDTPGHAEFVGAALAALGAVETAVLFVDPTIGVEPGLRRLFRAAGDAGLARMIVVNKVDAALGHLPGLVEVLSQTFGAEVHCMNLPARDGQTVIDVLERPEGAADFGDVARLRDALVRSAIDVDEVMFERHLAGKPLDLASLRVALARAMTLGHLVPVLFTSARTGVGVDALVHVLVAEAPSPLTGRPRRLVHDGALVEIPCTEDAPFLGYVFKLTQDPHLGPIAVLRVLQGRLDGSTHFVRGDGGKPRRAGHVLKVEGRDHPQLDATAYAGDLVALARIEELHAGDVLRDPSVGTTWTAPPLALPRSTFAQALVAKDGVDELELGAALARLVEEDPTLSVRQDVERRALVVSGLGEVQLAVLVERLANRFGLGVEAMRPSVAYRETCTQRAEGHCRHKEHTGPGQFADVHLRVEPLKRGQGFEFASEVFGGAIPRAFIGSVEQGVRDALEHGALAGFPVQDVRVTVFDGKAHAVEGKDVAFRTSAKLATRAALERARPALLEPIGTLEILVPEARMGEVLADLKRLRGRMLGFDVQANGLALLFAEAPIAELGGYARQLRDLTAGQGSFALGDVRYDFAPADAARRVAPPA
jgi:elongation factor G